jgi:peroxiredoxin
MRSLAILAVTAAMFSSTLAAQQRVIPQNLSNRRAPSWSLPDTKLQQHDILDYRGQWLLIMFMDTSCSSCKNLAKDLEQLRIKQKGRMDAVAIVIPPENMATVGSFLSATKITFPILFDSSQTAIPYFKATPANSVFDRPHLFAINPDGWIVKDYGGAQADDPKLMAELEQLVKNKGK